MTLKIKILDRYILTKFLSTFFFTVLLLIIVICVIDYTEKSGDFIKTNAPLEAIIFDYFGSFIPFITNTLSPIAVFIATVFVTSHLSSHTEIIAMLTSGMSFNRFLVPYLVGAIVLAGLIFYLSGWVIPHTAKRKVAFEIKYLKNPFYFEGRNIHFKVSDTTYVYMESYNNVSDMGYKFTLEKIKGQQLLGKLSADIITWDTTKLKWHLEKYYAHTFDGQGETMISGTNMDTSLNLFPKDFETTYGLDEMLTMEELNDYIQELKDKGAPNVETYLNVKYERYAYPFAIIILTMMGVIISAKKSRRGTGIQIAVGFVFAFVYIIFVIMSRSVAQAGTFPPLLAAWLPNLSFFLIATVMYFTVPR
jgi:lipopolysaccharide export system permease protein